MSESEHFLRSVLKLSSFMGWSKNQEQSQPLTTTVIYQQFSLGVSKELTSNIGRGPKEDTTRMCPCRRTLFSISCFFPVNLAIIYRVGLLHHRKSWIRHCTCWFLFSIPPHNVHWRPYSCSKLAVRKKLRTLPSLENANVIPNAVANSLSLNQHEVILFCTTEKKWKNKLCKCTY